ncbi:hypothetical protein Fuma_05921 [Fuerstiella marisgermanici]|uniref:Uncharacterized protein n=1 Tax=Fuerstiella marisgermanici TaxID=1891926 RepID=A0A1P8WQC8_9PLAN|nr:hypothetical protein Fuma_05921 [Fuerstiella marisgermanici]
MIYHQDNLAQTTNRDFILAINLQNGNAKGDIELIGKSRMSPYFFPLFLPLPLPPPPYCFPRSCWVTSEVEWA